MLQNNKYLHLVSLQSLINWSVAHLISRDLGFTKKFPFIRIGDIISRSTILITVEDEILYKQVTVKTNGGGAVLRDEKNGKKKGKDIGIKKQYIARDGQFIMSKIDARNGAFGIISKELEGAIVTGDFPLFDVNAQKVDPFYIYLLSTTKPFVKYAQSCSRGTTNRQRIDIDMFLSQEIPLPSLAEQKNIVDAYNYAISQAENYTQEADRIEKDILTYLNTILGINTREKEQHGYGTLFFKNLSQVSRWDVWNTPVSKFSNKYPLKSLEQIIIMQSGKFLPTKYQEKGIYNVYGGNGLIGTHSAYCFSGKRIVIGRVGEYCGNVHLIEGNYWITDNALKVDKITQDVTWEYLEIALKALNINQYKSISAQPSISQTKILQLQIPLPPLDIQNEIVEHIAALRTEQKELRQKALLLRQQATQQFERTIFE